MSNSLNDNLKTNIAIICNCKKTNKTKLSVYTEISESCIDRATANVPLGLSYENLTKLSLFSYLSIDELLLPYTKLIETRINRRQDWKFNTSEELHWLIEEDIAKNWEADKELMK